jgi:CPA1 family monovalent cation:H+ antiporter
VLADRAPAVLPAVGDFLRLSLGGLAVGLAAGYVVAQVIARIDDYLVEITLTSVAAYGSYLLAEGLHVSGVLAVVMAGLVIGNLGPRGMSPSTRIVLVTFWEYVAFLASSFVFLLIGLNIDVGELALYLPSVLVAIAAVLAARAVTVYGLGGLIRLWRGEPPAAYLHVMTWGGLRGAVSLALVLSLPAALPDQRQLLAMTFGVVLFTLLVQGTSIAALLRRFGFSGKDEGELRYERLQGELLATRAAHRRLRQLHEEGALVPQAWHGVHRELAVREEETLAAIDALLAAHPELGARILGLARREALRAQRSSLAALAREGLISGEVMAELSAELDAALLTEHGHHPPSAVPQRAEPA